jgi:hypothetical protein
MTALDPAAQAVLIADFVEQVPRLLESQPLTAGLVGHVRQLLEMSETPFTLAVIGQMRAGKSTLLNALIGQDLAVTGVNETTATVNWFKHGTDDQAARFRVHWKDHPAEELPLEELSRWVGKSEAAANTRYLEFFGVANFLKEVQVVDTPGTRSVLVAHEDALQDFLAEKRERESLTHGGAADAILYVLPPVTREIDEELLLSFESKTRLPGSGPFNSIAVLHKWEALDSPDPLAEARRKCERAAACLCDKVTAVLPVSGPLARACARLPGTWWQQAQALLGSSAPAMLEIALGLGEDTWRTDLLPDCPPPLERAALLTSSQLPWPCFRALLLIRMRRGPETDLRSLAREMAGTDALMEALRSRFFARARLIKTFTLLARAVEPCESARLRLQNRINELHRLIVEGTAARQSLEALAHLGTGLAPAANFIRHALEENRSELAALIGTEQQLSVHVRAVMSHYQAISADARCLRLVDEGHISLSEAERAEVRALLGCHGVDLGSRCSAYGAVTDLHPHLEARLNAWNALEASTFDKNLRLLAEHLTKQLGALLDFIEAKT